MKCFSDSNNNGSETGNNSNNNWLGFSLSPHFVKMEVTSDSQSLPPCTTSATASVPTSFCLTSTNHPLCFPPVGGGDDDSALPPPPLPLKSDGSLCILEDLRRSQTQVVMGANSAAPKLENFLGVGCATMVGAHSYNNTQERSVLSLDSIFYSTHSVSEEANTHPSLELIQEPIGQDHQHHPYYTALQFHGIYPGNHVNQLTENEFDNNNNDAQITTMPAGDFSSLKNWVSGPFSDHHHHSLEHHMNTTMLNNETTTTTTTAAAGSAAGAISYGDLQSLTLSMNPGSQSSCVTAAPASHKTSTEYCLAGDINETKKRSSSKVTQLKQPVHRKSIDTFGQRTSQYRGVTRHRWTGRYEAHLWDNSCKKEGQTRKGRQVYLGGYDMEEKAARAYDLAALKYWGPSTHINFPLENYHQELEDMTNMSRQEYVAHLRRKSSGFSRGASIYRGVTRHHQHGRWQARIGRVAGNKDLYLGTFSNQEEAAEAYDIAAIKFRGVNAVTNFDISRYDVERIMASNNTLPIGELARRNNKNNKHKDECETPSNINDTSQETVLKVVNNIPDSKVALYHHHEQQQQQQQQQQNMLFAEECFSAAAAVAGNNNYRNYSLLSSSVHDIVVGINSGNLNNNHHHQQEQSCIVDDQSWSGNNSKMGAHFSNSSSIVTSLNSSREASPDRNCNNASTTCFSKVSPLFDDNLGTTTKSSNLNSWIIPSAAVQISSMAHLPVFAAWGDI